MSRQNIPPDPTGQNGVLTKMIQQPIDNAIEISWQDGAKYVEKWKGPYAEMKEVTKQGGTIMGKQWLVGYGRPTLDTNWVQLIATPVPADGMVWMIDTIEVTEIEAGAHGELLITYKAVPTDTFPMNGYGGKEPSSEVSTEVINESSGWTLRWGTYSRNPLEYCTKEPNPYTGSNSENIYVAKVDNVIRCSQYPKPRTEQIPADMRDKTQHPPQYMWIEPNQAGESLSADVKELANEKERKIYNYYTRGVQPTFHYPVLTYTYTAEYGADYKVPFYVASELVDEKLKTELPDNCPFNLEGWEWLHCGTEAQVRKIKTIQKNAIQVTKTTTWEGALKIDENFYGDDNTRWVPGSYANSQDLPPDENIST